MSITEKRNPKTTHIDRMDTMSMLKIINEENMNSVKAIDGAIESIEKAVEAVSAALAKGGRLIYAGAGTSGRIAVSDAAECPPTFGVDCNTVLALHAGGRDAVFKAAEGIEDSAEAGRADLLALDITSNDVVMGISASGNASYVCSVLLTAKEKGCVTISLSNNKPCKIAEIADIPIVVITGPEVITGSTRMKAGNSQKMVLNMITTCAMVKTGHVYENLMINLKPTNIKLRKRMIGIVEAICDVDEEKALALLEANDFVIRKAVAAYEAENK
ncbi:MAG: N-acetylmuramic acid 6-phosphate etherase [Clostridia bacterium]|nr:N-acetylmuramic acid 6-phosphate etherase [Clostridia bacterium]